jgi:hypothetical protein
MATWQLGAHLGSKDPEHVSRWLNAMWAGRRAAPKCEGVTKTGGRCCGQRLYGSVRCIHHTRGAERDRVDMARLERQRRFAHSNCASERASALRQIRNIERRLLHRYWKINPEAEGSTLELPSSDERLTPKPSSSRVSSQWKSRVKSPRKSTVAGFAAPQPLAVTAEPNVLARSWRVLRE